MLNRPNVQARIAQLQERACKRHDVTIDSLTLELNEARQQAQTDPKGASAHVAAIMGKAKLHGLITDKQDTKVSGTTVSIVLSPDDAAL